MESTKDSKTEASVKFTEEPGYTVEMTITPDCLGFEIRIISDIPMDEKAIVDVLEDFLYQNILDGYSPHKTKQ